MKRFWRILCLLTMLAFSASALPLVAAAGGAVTRVDCEQVQPDGEWHDYELAKDVYAWCPLQLESNGRLNLSVQTSFEATGPYYIALLDENCEIICRTSLSSNGAADPTVWTTEYDLTAGLYFVRMESWNDMRGLFRIKADFAVSRGSEQAGETLETAVELAVPETLGFLSSKLTDGFYAEILPEDSQNFVDCFSFNVETDTFNISVTPVNPESNFGLTIYDAGYRQVTREYGNPSFSIDLESGQYYLCVEADGHLCGDYVLKIDWPGRAEATPAMPESGADAPDGSADIPQSDLDCELPNLQIQPGECIPLTNEETEGMNLRWGSTNPRVAVVSRDGMAIGVSQGSAYVAAVSEDGTAAIVYRVTVK